MASDLDERRGLVYGIAAYLLWGLFPLYWPLLEPAGAIEILAQRMVWSLVLVAVLVWRGRRFPAVRAVLADRRKRTLLGFAAVVVTVNWGTYIWAVNAGHVVETSLGYFINPLFTILLGVLLLHERLRRIQWIAVGIGTVAIIVLSVDSGHVPWIALVLATSFGLYGYFKKRVSVGAVESLTIETGYMAVPALVTLAVIGARGQLAFAHHGPGNTALLVLTGAVTAVPLLLFAAATRRLPLSVVGLLQYLAPVLQFGVGVGVDHETMAAPQWVGFALVWVALIVLAADGLGRVPRRPRRPGRPGRPGRPASADGEPGQEGVAVPAVPAAHPLDRGAVGLETVPAEHQHRRAGVGAEQRRLPRWRRPRLDRLVGRDRRDAEGVLQHPVQRRRAAQRLDQPRETGHR